MSAEPCCSFCQRPRSKVKKLIEGVGRSVFICDLCVKLAQTPLATIAHCSSCRPQHGKHDPKCPDQKLIA